MRRSALAAGVALAALLALPATHALGHQGNPDYRSELSGIEPNAPGVDVEVLDFDDSLRLSNDSGKTVVVDGYDGEPYIRILGDGTVQANARSPAYYLNDDRFAEVDVPSNADSAAPPEWETVDGTGQYAWHDHRIHYMGRGTPQQVSDKGERTKVFDYRVPIEVDGRPAAITGSLFWVGDDGGFPLAPFVGLAVAAAVLAAGIVVRRRRDRGSRGGDVSEPRQKEAGEAW